MIKPGSTSYPFLAVAREYGVPYRDVLEMADSLQNGLRNFVPTYLQQSWVIATIEAVNRETRRRRAA